MLCNVTTTVRKGIESETVIRKNLPSELYMKFDELKQFVNAKG